MSAWVNAAILASATLVAGEAVAGGQVYGLGTVPAPEQIAGWDIDIRPDGQGLPPGQSTPLDGEEVYLEQCAACHGEFGEAVGNYPALMGGQGTLSAAHPVKTVGSYWPYASTVFDYVRRAMPFGHAQSLSDEDVYGITAYLLYINEIIDEEFVVDAETLPTIEMPNADGFYFDDRPDTPLGEPCMVDCRSRPPELIGRARTIDVTPESDEAVADEPPPQEAAAAGDAMAMAEQAGDTNAGRRVYRVCAACHSLDEGQHRIGPSLHGLYGREAGAVDGFAAYSAALKGSGVAWSDETLRLFLADPQSFIAGNTMPFAGVKDSEDLDDLLAYLREATSD